MSVKFIEYWDLQPLVEEKFAKYLTREWIPGMNGLGITILAVWKVLVGTCPRFVSEGVSDDISQLKDALGDERHSQLNEGLFQWAEHYSSRVMAPTGLVPTLIGEPKDKAIKLIQYWDTRYVQKERFTPFLTEEFVPALEEMGLVIGGHWKTLIGPAPNEKLEGRANSLEEVSAVLNNPNFLKLRAKLQDYVVHYESRILKLKVVRITGRAAVTYEYL